MPPMSEEERKARNRERSKAYYEANRDRIKAYREANKEEIRDTNKAYYQANKEKLLKKRKAWYEANREKIAEYKKAYREANKEKKAEYDKAYYEANREKILERSKAYCEANKEKKAEYNKVYREANKEKKAEYDKAYYKANKEMYFQRVIKRRALKKKSIPKLLINCPVEKDRLYKIYKLRSIISEATGVEHHVDHMWPLSDGGPHWSGNLQIITAKENLSKNASVCEETKKVIQESLEYALQEYKRRKDVRDNNT